ncbi:MAG: erythronate-4-phosphate dehydrogenase, partial [Muribaculaceae bacterium]|nr:erythronate-4-phosphate dehydrogenase [Muribaculaceae bacterium]
SLMHVINRPLASYTIGVIGVGHVGEIVVRWAKALGMRVLPCDPPRQRAEGGDHWTDMATIAREADIITVHTPLTHGGDDPTFHMLGSEYLETLRRAPIVINTARGEIADTEALVKARKEGYVGGLVIDCWEGEPEINPELLALADIATPHIAGYSKEGKIRASQQALDAITTFFMLPRVTVDAPPTPPAANRVSIADVMKSFDPMPLTLALKASPAEFEPQRNSYELRNEVPERQGL